MSEEIRKKIIHQSRSVRELIYETIKEAILSEQYEPGFHLRERELAEEFGVSTTPIKEALRHLEKEGLVITKARRGTFVSTNLMSSVEEINWSRAALEGVAARLAALKGTDSEVVRLADIIQHMELYTKQEDSKALEDYNSIFHDQIRQMAKNDFISQQIEAVLSFDRYFRKKALSHPEELGRAFSEHNLIYLKIKEKDPDGAEEAMRNHIKRTIYFVKDKHTGL